MMAKATRQPFDETKARELLLYVLKATEEDSAGTPLVKLKLLLYAADMGAYLKGGRTITGFRYVKRQFGPSPVGLHTLLKKMEAEGVMTWRRGKASRREKADDDLAG